MGDQQFSDRMGVLDDIYRTEAASRPWIRYLDSRPVLSAPGSWGSCQGSL